jgi:hypothetical protein
MTAGLATLLILAAGFLIMISGVLSKAGGEHLRSRAGCLILLAISLPLAVSLLASLPRWLILGAFIAVSILAFLFLEARYRILRPTTRLGDYMNYRASGKVPVHEGDLSSLTSDTEALGVADDEIP